MPIEIRELHIRVVVNTPQRGQPSGGPSVATGVSDIVSGGDDERDAIVAECVEQVLQILQNKTER